jgi:hypothetical protein
VVYLTAVTIEQVSVCIEPPLTLFYS